MIRDDLPDVKKLLFCLAGGLAALAFPSCAYTPYDPYYATNYRVGYGEGYGYGGRTFATTFFISTGDSRWGYDPDCHSYYDYRSRCYYDPYLYGYYPVGYRPVYVYGTPHPHGWSPGRNTIRPPSRVTNITISNYRDRESSYRSSSYSWARQVQQRPITYDRAPEPRTSNSQSRNRYFTDHSNTNFRHTRTTTGDQSESQIRDSGTQREPFTRQPNVTRQVNVSTPAFRSPSQSHARPGTTSSAAPQPTQRPSFEGGRSTPSSGARTSGQTQPSSGRTQIPSRSPFGGRKNDKEPGAQ